MSLAHLTWALRAEALTPSDKLVLILAANACDQDGLVFDHLDRLAAEANLTEEAFIESVTRLTLAQMATFGIAEDPSTGARKRCLQVLFTESTDGR